MPLGGLISLAVLLPNILILLLPPAAAPAAALEEKRGREFQVMRAIERVGQAGSFVIPFFYALPPLRGASADALFVMALALLLYYTGWLRYASKRHRYILLFAPLFGIPLPMVIAPVLYLGAAAVFLRAWPLGVAALLLAIGHIYVSQDAWTRCRVPHFMATPE